MSDTKIRVRKATALLREDHENVKQLFSAYEEIEKEDVEQKSKLFRALKKELTIHAQIEEEIFYPAIEGSGDEEAEELIKEANEEHRLVKQLLEELAELGPESDDFDAKLKVLKENVLHHAEEEQEEIFPCFDELDKDEREQISETLASRKQQLSQEGIEEEPE
jgi:iron-sulfur cluster repair protein YtfE (RIC family)